MTLFQGKFAARHHFPRGRRYQKKKKTRRHFLAMAMTLGILGSISIYNVVQQALLQPEAIFVLGGHEEREKFAAQFAQANPTLDIWVSSGSPPDYAKEIFSNYGVVGDRLHLDYKARDTVTNFTSILQEFKQQDIDSVYLITSENHMHRAKVVAQIIFGSQGIRIKPVAVPSENPPEAKIKCWRDGLRSLLWVVTGETGAEWFEKKSATVITKKKL